MRKRYSRSFAPGTFGGSTSARGQIGGGYPVTSENEVVPEDPYSSSSQDR